MVISPQYAPSNVELLLVGNKCDCESQREVSYNTAKEVSFRIKVNNTWSTAYSIQSHMAYNTLRQVKKQVTMLMK